jgi:cytoskeletal protein RodZ
MGGGGVMLTDDELRAVLRAEAAAHRPDRVSILSRVTQTAMRNEAARRRAPRVRIAGAAAAVAAVIGGGGFAQWALAGGTGSNRPTPPPPPSSVSAAPSSSPSASPAPEKTSAKPQRPPSRPASPSANPSTPGPLRADGSVDVGGKTQASSVVTIKTSESLTALRVTIRVARTPGLVARGGSQQVPGASVNSSVTDEAGALVYHFTLSSGDTLEPGTYTFSARYTYAEGGRDAGADTYSADATSGSGAALTVGGDFG